MLRFSQSVFVCLVPWLLAGCGQSWPAGQDAIESHFAEHREAMVNLAAAIEASEYVRVSLDRAGKVYAEEYPGGRSRLRGLRDAEAERWRQLFVDARVPIVFIDELGIVGLDVRHTVAGAEGLEWRVFYRLKPGRLYPDPVCSDDHRDAPCGRCRVDLDESWSVFFEWLPESLDMNLTLEYVEGDMTMAEAKKRYETVFQACSASRGRTFELPKS